MDFYYNPVKSQQERRLEDGSETHSELTGQRTTVKHWDSLPWHALEAKCAGGLQEGLNVHKGTIHLWLQNMFVQTQFPAQKKILILNSVTDGSKERASKMELLYAYSFLLYSSCRHLLLALAP